MHHKPTTSQPQASSLSLVQGAFFSNACRYSFNQCVFAWNEYPGSKGIPYEGFGAINGINDLRQLARFCYAIRVRATVFCSSTFLTLGHHHEIHYQLAYRSSTRIFANLYVSSYPIGYHICCSYTDSLRKHHDHST